MLVVGAALVYMALKKGTDVDVAKQVFAVVGVLFGLLAAGGVGSLFANQAAETAASGAAEEASTQAADKVSSEVQSQVETAIEETSPAAPKK